jgi:fructose-specific phosphotransferase system IIB component
MRIVAVTACATGIAHTYMAAEQLERAAKALGHLIKVETQGSLGIENPLSEADIRAAEIAILATDIEIEGRERFAGMRVLELPVKEAARNATAILAGIAK